MEEEGGACSPPFQQLPEGKTGHVSFLDMGVEMQELLPVRAGDPETI